MYSHIILYLQLFTTITVWQENMVKTESPQLGQIQDLIELMHRTTMKMKNDNLFQTTEVFPLFI